MQDNKDGTYCVSYTPKEPGVYTVLVCVREQHVRVSRTFACPPWPSLSLLPLASTISGCRDMSRGISCMEGLNRILFLPSPHLRNEPDFAGDHNSVPIPPPGCWLVFYHSPLRGILNLGKIPSSQGAFRQGTSIHIQAISSSSGLFRL